LKFNEIVSSVPVVREQDAVDKIRGFSFVNAIEFALAVVVISVLITWVALEWEWRNIVKLCAVVGSLPFLMVAWEKFVVLSAHQHKAIADKMESQAKQVQWKHQMAVMEAELEKLLNVDLNKSGAVGDVVEDDAPVPAVQHHFVNTNVLPPEHVIAVGDAKLDLAHFIEFVRKQEARQTIRREDWLGSKAEQTEAYVFMDGCDMTRTEYDLCLRILDEHSRSLKGAGTARRVIHSASQILEYLQIAEPQIT